MNGDPQLGDETMTAYDPIQYVSEGSGGLVDWLKGMDPEQIPHEIKYALNDLPVRYGDPVNALLELADEFDNLPGYPTQQFNVLAGRLLHAMLTRMDEFREAEV